MGDYNALAGRALDRIWNLSDSVFAFAMTILALQVRAPDPRTIHSEAALAAALIELWPRAATYVTSFITLGVFWVAQQTQHRQMGRSDRNAAWLHLTFLMLVVFLPFSTDLLASFIRYRTALLFYWMNILLLGAVLLAAWTYASVAGLLKPEADAEVVKLVRRRIVVAQTLYTFGAALCVFGTIWSIGFIFLVQLNYAVAPPIRWLRRLTT